MPRRMVDVLPECAVEISEWWRKKRVASMHGSAAPRHFGTVRRGEPKMSPTRPVHAAAARKISAAA
jgi:hypothetical protein